AHGAASDVVLLRRRPRGIRLRRSGVCAGNHADRHARHVVAGTADAGLGTVACRVPYRLALRGRTHRLFRRVVALVRRSAAADVLLLCHAACAVPRSRDHTGARPHSRERTTRLRTTWHGAVGRLVVRRVGGGELRVALADPERHVDHDGALAGRTLAPLLALVRHRARHHSGDGTVDAFTRSAEPPLHLVVDGAQCGAVTWLRVEGRGKQFGVHTALRQVVQRFGAGSGHQRGHGSFPGAAWWVTGQCETDGRGQLPRVGRGTGGGTFRDLGGHVVG